MATINFVEINIAEAAPLADLTGVRYDLASARQFAGQLAEMLSPTHPGNPLVEPLSIAIIIRYNRAFTEGVRKWVREEALNHLNEDQRQKHAYFRELRNKHIAHSVNCFEESVPVARYSEEHVREEGVTAISCQHHMVVSLSRDDLTSLVELASIMIEFIDKKIEDEKAQLLRIVRAIPLEQVLSWGKRPIVPGRGRVDRRRARNFNNHT